MNIESYVQKIERENADIKRDNVSLNNKIRELESLVEVLQRYAPLPQYEARKVVDPHDGTPRNNTNENYPEPSSFIDRMKAGSLYEEEEITVDDICDLWEEQRASLSECVRRTGLSSNVVLEVVQYFDFKRRPI